jgi:hypothetical protein
MWGTSSFAVPPKIAARVSSLNPAAAATESSGTPESRMTEPITSASRRVFSS